MTSAVGWSGAGVTARAQIAIGFSVTGVLGVEADEDSWLSAWAKSFFAPESGVTGWLPLWQHSVDSGAVAGLLVDRWVSHQVVDLIAEDLPQGRDDARLLARWLAGVHDVGKLSPAFAVQVGSLADRMRDAGLVVSPLLAVDPHRARITHSLVGFAAVRDWLSSEAGFPRRGLASGLASIVASHHGIAPEQTQLAEVRQFSHLAGTGPWAQARAQMLEFATDRLGGRERLASLAGVRLSRPAAVLLTGIVIMADWIASNTDLFPPQSSTELHSRPPLC
ncbi:CRISPR-associated endonuclease Cas3'' [Amycolatopsis acidicola]|uniref:CRISPR-associated endonuclease Cas3'' n=1 Tax=Amycolatopsis acidicola TaxID=2596893 RepID=UPI00140B8714|nr:CRISPR-associated endonuclease Cas3'' [Amycolatopsis acidicola]